jgi:hypothetical protein
MLESIAIESGVVANMIETFKRIVPSFASNLHDTNMQLAEASNAQQNLSIKLDKKERNAIDMSKHLNYLTFGDRLVSVPEGFKGNFIEYAILLNDVATIAYQTQNAVLFEYNHILSAFLTNKDDKISLKDHTVFFNRIKTEREAFARKLAVYLDKSNGTAKARFKHVLTRMNDIETLIKETSRLTSQHSRAKLTDMNNGVNQCVDLLNLIISGVQDGTIKNISPNATMNISRGAYEVAKYVEFVGVIYFDITVFLNCVNGMLDTIVSPNK